MTNWGIQGMKLFLIRHAQSQNNALPTSQRVQDAPITELGIQQARQLGQWARHAGLDMIFTSPFLRALQTSQQIHETVAVEWTTWTQLHEQGGCVSGVDTASFEGQPGMTAVEIQQAFPGCQVTDDIDEQGWWKSQPRETEVPLRERVLEVKDHLVDALGSTDRTIACVTHADFSDLLISALQDHPVHPTVPLRGLFNTGITSFTIEGSRVQLDDYNNVDHLSPELVT